MLLSLEEANPDRPDGSGRTPLSRAAQKWNEGVMEILLGREEVTLTSQIITAEHCSRSLLGVATRSW